MSETPKKDALDEALSSQKLTPTAILLGVLSFVVIFLIAVWILKVCWNESLPKMFSGANKIDYITAMAFMIVAFIIFKR